MPQSYKIFFGQISIFITSEKKNPNVRSYMIVSINKKSDIEFIASILKLKKVFKNIILHTSNPKDTFNYFARQFDFIKAAGGVVLNKKGEVLFILRKGKWDLPKGKLEQGEGKKAGARREVIEETGVENPKVVNLLEETYHIGKVKGRTILKKTTWYEMTCKKCSSLTPQLDEGITDAKWVSLKEQPEMLEKVYENLKPILLLLQKRHQEQL